MASKLSDLEIQRALGTLPGWSRRSDVLVKTFTFSEFADGLDFLQRAGRAAEKAQHHPDIDIRFTKITMMLTTHDAGGITQADLDMASTIEQLGDGA